ncbi:GntR family transcriptional regulator [Amycolatopsis acidicola]|uniref:GntR family transcriptional regulator n=1 Tax=Amycolatopsis acidicola TaxID=2596893 RepID=A0A5N0VHX4_9PSEU|nr:GntR family transcriptional regulator [Amycolatopsis acidicola]KAA9165846.1 GntR family transcriptional regulator [Amycolatopsis acidicola]
MTASGVPESDDRPRARKVYEYLRDGIIEGELPPGSRLLERELSERLGVSRIPIREALPQLEAEGLITTLPRRGAVVTQLTLRDIGELFDVRTSLDVLAARLASRQPRERAVAALGPALARAELATTSGSGSEIAAANSAFHEMIVRLSASRLLQSMMAPISARVRWLFRLTADRDPDVLCSEHHELYDAICDGDTDLAASLAFTHVERGRRPSLASLAGVLPAGAEPTPEDLV